MLVKINVEPVLCPFCGKDKLTIGIINMMTLVAVCKACKRMERMEALLVESEADKEEAEVASAV